MLVRTYGVLVLSSLKPFCVSSEQGFTNVDLKISLYVSVHTKTIP